MRGPEGEAKGLGKRAADMLRRRAARARRPGSSRQGVTRACGRRTAVLRPAAPRRPCRQDGKRGLLGGTTSPGVPWGDAAARGTPEAQRLRRSHGRLHLFPPSLPPAGAPPSAPRRVGGVIPSDVSAGQPALETAPLVSNESREGAAPG